MKIVWKKVGRGEKQFTGQALKIWTSGTIESIKRQERMEYVDNGEFSGNWFHTIFFSSENGFRVTKIKC